MKKTETIIDTCFLQRITDEGKAQDNFITVMDELGLEPVVHPYIADHEFSLYPYSRALVDAGKIRKIEYDEFIADPMDKSLYEMYFSQLYEDLRKCLDAKGGPKKLEPFHILQGHSIYDTHKAGSSMGDVHMMLMAFYMRMPIILTEDSDITLLRAKAKERMSVESFHLKIYNGVDLINQIAAKPNSLLSKKDLENILLVMRRKDARSKMKQIWNEAHMRTSR